MNTYEEQKAIVAKFNVIDDVFFQKMVEDIEVAEEMLRIILRKPKLKVIKCQAQRFLRNTSTHSVVLDALQHFQI
jgi:propanediol dehydratase large subunit